MVLVRKFMACKILPEAKQIIDMIDLMEKEDPPYENAHLFTTRDQRRMIKDSLHQIYRVWEMEP